MVEKSSALSLFFSKMKCATDSPYEVIGDANANKLQIMCMCFI